MVETDSGTVRRNRQHLTVIPERTDIPAEQDQTHRGPRASPIMTKSKTGTPIVPPDRL